MLAHLKSEKNGTDCSRSHTTSDDTFLTRYMTIDKVPDCIGVMKFERVKDGDEKETKEVDMDD